MSTVLFFCTAIITYVAFQYSKLRLLSPTLWASGMFMAFSFVYAVTLFSMKSDISAVTFFVILGFLLVTALGERIGHLPLELEKSSLETKRYVEDGTEGIIKIEAWKVVVLTLLFLVVAMSRYRNLVSLVSAELENGAGIMQLMTAARLEFIRLGAAVTLGNPIFNQLIYICEITTYFMFYVFIYNFVHFKIRQFYLLLPFVSDLMIRFLSTSRTSFMLLGVGVLVCYFTVLLQKDMKRLHVSPKLVVGVGLFVIVFLAYGRVRNNAQTIPIASYVQMYTCSSLYGLDDLLKNGWNDAPYFGYHTMKRLYHFLRISHDTVKSWEPMLVFSKNQFRANVYTSLADPIRDYGIVGCMLIRFITAFAATRVINRFRKMQLTKPSCCVYLFFSIAMIYCYFYSATGDVFSDYYLNPGLMIRYAVYGWLLAKFFLKPKLIRRQCIDDVCGGCSYVQSEGRASEKYS